MKSDEDKVDQKNSTKFCKHEGSCLTNVFDGSVKTMKWCFMIKYLISKMLRVKQIPKLGLFKVLFSQNGDTVIFSAVLTMI